MSDETLLICNLVVNLESLVYVTTLHMSFYESIVYVDVKFLFSVKEVEKRNYVLVKISFSHGSHQEGACVVNGTSAREDSFTQNVRGGIQISSIFYYGLHTLMELLDKRWRCSASSPTEAPFSFFQYEDGKVAVRA